MPTPEQLSERELRVLEAVVQTYIETAGKRGENVDEVRKAHPGYEIAVTGLSAIAARNSG